MEIIKLVFAVPLGLIALFFLYIGWRRANRFNFHDYHGNQQERLRDNFFSHLSISCSFSCALPIMSPINLWFMMIPITLLLILVLTAITMLGAYWSSFLAGVMTGGRIRTNRFFWQNTEAISALEWYELTPFALVVGWVVYFLVYAIILLASGIEITSENAPDWSILVGLGFGIMAAFGVAIGIRRKFRAGLVC